MFKPRPKRLDWVYTSYPIYFVTACTKDRRQLLAQGFVHEALVAYFRRAAELNVAVGRYVLMPDHLHLFVAFPPSPPTLSEWVKGLKRAVATVLAQNGIAGPYWQKGFFDHVLRSAESYSKEWSYVSQNPVRAGFVARASDWPFQGEIHRLTVQ